MSTPVSVHCCDDKMCPVSTPVCPLHRYLHCLVSNISPLFLLLLLVSISFYYYWSLVTIFLSFFFTQLPLLFIFMLVGPATSGPYCQ